MKAVLIAIVMMVSLFVPAFGQSVLKGGVEHAEKLAPVENSFLPGRVFDERSLPPMGVTVGWYRIPNWYAGLWHRETQVTKGFLGIKHEMVSRRDQPRGYQMDALGSIWEYHSEPMYEIVQDNTWIEYKVVRVKEPISVSAHSVAMRFLTTSIRMDKRTGLIARTYQAEEFQTWHELPDALSTVDTSIRIYDCTGNPVAHEKGTFVDRRIRAFEPVNELRGKDLRADFKRFFAFSWYGRQNS